MAEELMVVLKRSENSGFGFSLLGTTGPPHVIYDIVENSPAAESGEVEAGDIIIKINGTDVHRYTTKEVLKCLRLSDDLVTLELKRDPKIKAHIKEHLARTSNIHHSDVSPTLSYSLRSFRRASQSTAQAEEEEYNYQGYSSSCTSPTADREHDVAFHHRVTSSDPTSCRPSRIPTAVKTPPPKCVSHSPQHKKNRPSQIPTSTTASANGNNLTLTGQSQLSPQPTSAPPVTKARFEAYMMTGDLILNLSRTPQSSNFIATHAKKVDSLRDTTQRTTRSLPNGAAPRASGESTPSSSSSPTTSEKSDSINSIKNREKNNKDSKISDKILNSVIANDLDSQSVSQSNLCVKVKSGLQSKSIENYPSEYSVRSWGGGDADEHMSTTISACISSSSSSINKHENLSNTDAVDSANRYQKHRSGYSKQPISSSSSSTAKSEAISSPETSFSVPTSPTSLSTPLLDTKDTANSVPTSPEQSLPEVVRRQHNGVTRKCDASGFRTSKSEDHLQQVQRDGLGAVIPIDIDEDVNSSLNTLLDTRHDSEDSQDSNRDRIVWTYNAPVSSNHHHHHYTTTSPNSHSSSISNSPQRSDSPASPTSVSSSVMSSNSGSKAGVVSGMPYNAASFLTCPVNGDQSVSEAVSNISSPDYQDDDNLLFSSKDLAGMTLSDLSDSDSTILVSEAVQRKRAENAERDHKIVIKVKGDENKLSNSRGYAELQNSEDELVTLTEETPTHVVGGDRDCSPPISDDGSDADSLHSYHYSPKAVDMPSAIRLAKRLHSLDGFKKSDVSRHLSKNNDFSRAVADEYLKYFDFEKHTLDEALRQFLQQFSLSGETQERERVLVHFSKRYLDCNPGSFNSQDAVHTLTCAIMLLNTDLHGQNIGRKMTCSEFVDNLAELNDGDNFPKEVLKLLYQAIKCHPLEWALDDESQEQQKHRNDSNLVPTQLGANPFLDTPQSSTAIEYKKGYVMRKCCYESNYKKTPFGKRSWKMFYCTLRDLVLFLHKDEHGFRKSQMSDNVHNAIRIHHSLASKATDYTKKQHVFRLQTADQSEFLFQTSDSKELQSWIDTINFVCASFSAKPLEGGVGSQKRFQRPLLPSTHTKLLMREQLSSHEQQVAQLESSLNEHKRGPVPPSKGLPLQNYKEKEAYLQHELKRYKTYVSILNARMLADQQLDLHNSLFLNNDDVHPSSVNNPQRSSIGGGAGSGAVLSGLVIDESGTVANNLIQQQAVGGSTQQNRN